MSDLQESEPRLKGACVLVTRAREDAGPLVTRLQALGAHALTLPVVEIAPPDDIAPLDNALRRLGRYDWVAFASRYAVKSTFRRLEALDVPFPAKLRVAAIGPGTAEEVEERRVTVDCVPEEASADSLAKALLAQGAAGKSILQPAGDLARPELRERLEGWGAKVDVVEAYKTVMPEGADQALLDAVTLGQVDVIALASPSAARNLARLLGENALRNADLACIGPTTAEAVRELGLMPAAIARTATLDGLVDAIVDIRLGVHG
jgi:uroporphyrinogen-III synthase